MLEGTRLEERVVLNGARPSIAQAVVPGNAQQIQANRRLLNEIQLVSRGQVANASQTLRNLVRSQMEQLYANGRPTAQQIANFNATVGGAINAAALGLLSQYDLLPGTTRLANQLQTGLLGSQPGSLSSRVATLAARAGNLRSPLGLSAALNRQIATAFQNASAQLGNYFNTTPISRLSVGQNGGVIPLTQFMGNRLVDQFNGGFSNLANNFNAAARSVLFPNVDPGMTGVIATPDAQNAFQRQIGNALGAFAYQIGNAARIIPGATTGLLPQLNTVFFGTPNPTGTGLTGGLSNTLSDLSINPLDLYVLRANDAFTNSFAPAAAPFSTFFNTTPQTSLPAGTTFTNLFNTNFASNQFNSGFNSGFGTGVLGFGTAPAGFDNNFGTGFNNYVNTLNQQLGFIQPNFGPGTGM